MFRLCYNSRDFSVKAVAGGTGVTMKRLKEFGRYISVLSFNEIVRVAYFMKMGERFPFRDFHDVLRVLDSHDGYLRIETKGQGVHFVSKAEVAQVTGVAITDA
jgi:lipopolysaccharide biosynthesis protein